MGGANGEGRRPLGYSPSQNRSAGSAEEEEEEEEKTCVVDVEMVKNAVCAAGRVEAFHGRWGRKWLPSQWLSK